MTSLDSALPVASEPDALANAPRIKGRTREAIDLMLTQGMPRDQAAKSVGLNPKTLYNAFREPRVRQYYSAGLDVLRMSTRARNIHRLEQIRDAANNMPAVQAIKALEQLDDIATGSSPMQRAPGLQIVIMQKADSTLTIDATAEDTTAAQRLPTPVVR